MALSDQRIQLLQGLLRFRSSGVVDADVCVMNQSVLTDDIASWHWQRPGGIAVVSLKVNAKTEINFAQFVRQCEHQVELIGKGVVLVSQYRYGKVELLY